MKESGRKERTVVLRAEFLFFMFERKKGMHRQDNEIHGRGFRDEKTAKNKPQRICKQNLIKVKFGMHL